MSKSKRNKKENTGAPKQSADSGLSRGNPVAKHARKFNVGGPMRDRKKANARGERKHKGDWE